MSRREEIRTDPEVDITTDQPAHGGGGPEPGLGDDHPLNEIMGTYEGPVWERILKNIKRNRKLEDGQTLAKSD